MDSGDGGTSAAAGSGWGAAVTWLRFRFRCGSGIRRRRWRAIGREGVALQTVGPVLIGSAGRDGAGGRQDAG